MIILVSTATLYASRTEGSTQKLTILGSSKMTIREARQLLKRIKYAIQDANNAAQWQRVQYLKSKKEQIKKKILIALTKPTP